MQQIPDEIRKKFLENLGFLRRTANLAQSDLARLAEVNMGNIALAESGDSIPDEDVNKLMAYFTGVIYKAVKGKPGADAITEQALLDVFGTEILQ